MAKDRSARGPALLLLIMVCGLAQAAAMQAATIFAPCTTQPATPCPRNGKVYYLCKSGRAKFGCRPAKQGPFPATSCAMQCTTGPTLSSPSPSRALSGPSPPRPPRSSTAYRYSPPPSSPPTPPLPAPDDPPAGSSRRLRWSDEFSPGSSINQVSGYWYWD